VSEFLQAVEDHLCGVIIVTVVIVAIVSAIRGEDI
jgi:hypothetical protein